MEEVDAICNRAIIVAGGKIVADSTPADLRKRAKNYGALTVSFRSEVPVDATQVLANIAGVRSVSQTKVGADKTYFTLLPNGQQDLVESLIKEADNRQWRFGTFYVDSGQLDEVFRSITMER